MIVQPSGSTIGAALGAFVVAWVNKYTDHFDVQMIAPPSGGHSVTYTVQFLRAP